MGRAELAALKVSDIDWDVQVAVVMGKGQQLASTMASTEGLR